MKKIYFSEQKLPCSKIFTVQGGTSFVDLIYFLCLVFARPLCASVYMCFWSLVVKGLTSWLSFVVWHFPIGILGQVWYLIVSIPDLCTLTYSNVTVFHWIKGTSRGDLNVYNTISFTKIDINILSEST